MGWTFQQEKPLAIEAPGYPRAEGRAEIHTGVRAGSGGEQTTVRLSLPVGKDELPLVGHLVREHPRTRYTLYDGDGPFGDPGAWRVKEEPKFRGNFLLEVYLEN